MLKILLRNMQAPGDVLMLTAAVRDLYRAHSQRMTIAVDSPYPELWENNPHLVSKDDLGGADRIIDCEYPLIHEANRRPFHFIHGFVQDLEQKLELPIPVGSFRGDIHLSDKERSTSSPAANAGYHGRYWIIVAGGKQDFTTKWWNPDSYQAVVDHFLGKIQFVQCGSAGDSHPPLRNVVNMVGRTALREFVRLMYHADGIVCPVTFAMHLAAAVPQRPGHHAIKPCVVIAGGREPPHWEMYPGHQFLHTVGALDCCATGGCWKSRCQPIGDGDVKDNSLCVYPVRVRDDLQIARCMTMITPNKVIEAIDLYADAGKTSGGSDISRSHSPATEVDVPVHVRPRGVAVTVGIGRFDKLAHLAAREMQAMTGLDSVVLGPQHLAETNLEHPSFLKFRLFDLVKAENILWFDADQVCLDRWDPRQYFGEDSIVAVRDRMLDSVIQDCREWDIPPADYFNAGMFIANAQKHRDWLRLAESLRFFKATTLQDQSPLNAARCRLGIGLKLLDRRFNWLGFGASSLSLEMPVILAHKLAPDRMDLNEAYFHGKYELSSPQIRFNEPETARLRGRSFNLVVHGRVTGKYQFRDDGTLLPAAPPDTEGYWFVQDVKGRPTLALAAESTILQEFIEALGGEWIKVDDGDVRLVESDRDEPPLSEDNARAAVDRFIESMAPYPVNKFRGRGIVICGGGEKYLPSAWVCIRMLRHLGCRLPIEFWQLRNAELPETVRPLLRQLDVHCVDAGQIRQQHPIRFLSGWELKPYAILHSGFEQLFYLDADNLPVIDPTYLFDSDEFTRTGGVFWPDYGRIAADRAIWRICGISYRDEPEFESGQMLIDKRRCWKPLQVTMHMNNHSDFYYRYIHGDKDTFHMAWRMLEQSYSMVPHPIHGLSAAMCQHDFAGNRVFQHRNLDKWRLGGGNRRVEGFDHEELCRTFLAELAAHWQINSVGA